MLAARGGRDGACRPLAPSYADACNPLLQAHPTWARDKHEGRGFPLYACLPSVSPLRAPSCADPSGLGHTATIYSSVQGPPGVETPTIGNIGFVTVSSTYVVRDGSWTRGTRWIWIQVEKLTLGTIGSNTRNISDRVRIKYFTCGYPHSLEIKASLDLISGYPALPSLGVRASMAPPSPAST
jgi:hypothetical protein